MTVAIVEPVSTHDSASGPRDAGLETANSVGEWIDPEGDDWFL